MTMAVFQLPVSIETHVARMPNITIYIPQITGLKSREVENRINHVIHHTAVELYHQQLNSQSGTLVDMYGHYEIKTNERGLLSLILSNAAYSKPMAHGNTLAKSLTFDTATGHIYTLPELFKPGSNYMTVLTEMIKKQIKQRDLPLIVDFTSIKPDQDFYLADKALIVYFVLYEITPYYVGFPMFPISVYDLLPIATENGPLSILSIAIA